MAILNFPNTRQNGDPLQSGDQYTGDNSVTYIFDGVKWVGHSVAQPAGTNSITNNGNTVQVDPSGNLVIPVGAIIKDENGTQYGGSGPSLGDYTFFGPVLNVPTGEAHINAGGVGVRNSAEIKTVITENSGSITSAEIALQAGNGGISAQVYGPWDNSGIHGSGGPTLVYAGVENLSPPDFPSNLPGFAGFVAIDPGVTSQYAVSNGEDGKIFVSFGEPVTTESYTAALGVLTDNIDLETGRALLNGILVDPNYTIINGKSSIIMSTDRGTVLFGNQPEICTPTGASHFHIMKGGDATDLFFGDDFNYVKLPNLDNGLGVEIGTDVSNIWRFGTDGSLTFPSGAQIIADSQDGTYLQANPGINGYAGLSSLTGNSWMWTANDGGAYISSSDGYTGGTWSFNTNSNLTIPGDIQDANGSVIRVASTSTAPTRVNGQLWFNNEEGRLYIKDNGVWVDANPTVIPPPSTYLDDITVEGSTFTINGSTLTIDSTGTLLVNGDQVTGITFTNSVIQEGSANSGIPVTSITGLANTGISLTSDRWAQLMWVPDATAVSINDIDDGPNAYNWVYVDYTGFFVETNDGTDEYRWEFNKDGGLTFPDNTVQTTAYTGINPKIWVQTFETDDVLDIVQMAISVEYDADNNIVALFDHVETGNNNSSYYSVGKFTPTGTRVWTARFSAGFYTDGWGLAVDQSAGSIYVTGSRNTDAPGEYTTSVLAKLNGTNGQISWAQTYDFGYESNIAVVDVASDGNPVMVGYASDGDDNYIATTKVDKDDGAVIWTRKINGQATEEAYGMAVGPNGEVVVVGYIDQLSPIDTDNRIVVVKYASDGTIAWQKAIQFDAGWDCNGADADIDSNGNIYVCGNYNIVDGFGTTGIGILKLDSAGVKQWSRRVVGPCTAASSSIVVGPDNKLYISANVLTPSGFNWVVAKYGFDGSVEWQKFVDNTTTDEIAGTSFNGGGGGSNLAVNSNYVALGGGFGDLVNGGPSSVRAVVAQVPASGTAFVAGDWDFTESGLSGTLNSSASDVSVVDAQLTDSDNTLLENSSQSLNPDISNFLLGTIYRTDTQPVGRLTNGTSKAILQSNGTLINELGRNLTGELDRRTDSGNYFGNQPIGIKNASGYKRLLGVTDSAQTWFNITDLAAQLDVNPAWIMGVTIEYQAQSSNFSGGSNSSMTGQIIIASSNDSSRDISVTHSEAVLGTSNNSDSVFANLNMWRPNGWLLQAIRTDSNSQQLDIIWTAKVFINASEDYC